MPGEDSRTRIGKTVSGRTILQLVIASIIVGAIFSFIGVSPREFWRGLFNTVSGLLSSLGDNISEIALTLGTYLLIGAAIVVPIWLVSRVLSSRK